MSIVIEDDTPVPVNAKRNLNKDIKKAVQMMKPEQSIYIPNRVALSLGQVGTELRREGIRYVIRQEGTGIRVWRIV